MEYDSSGSSNDRLAKNLFGDSPSNIRRRTASPIKIPYDIWGHEGRGSEVAAPRMGCFGATIFFTLCFLAVALTIQFNAGEWRNFLSLEALQKFFSNELLRDDKEGSVQGVLYFNGSHFYGLGALPLAIAVGVICALFTCVFTFYDSDIPGNFPPTPVSQRNQNKTGVSPKPSQWHLGYIFVVVNCMVAFSLSLFYLRWNMGLPLI